jgi:rubredoxin-NAD+ reductase
MRIIILGAGLAGQLVVKALRENASEAEIQIFSAHSAGFYSKPSLSNLFTQGKSPEQLVMKDESALMSAYNCDIHTNTHVLSIDRNQKAIHTTKGLFEYDKLVLALGAEPPKMQWLPESANVFRVNHIDDYHKFYPRVHNNAHIVIIGGGLIGVEFAHDIAPFCHQVTLIEKMPGLMAAMLPKEVGSALEDALTQRGVRVMTGSDLSQINDQGGHVSLVVDGKQLIADTVLAAIGLRPNTQLAQDAGLAVNLGIQVNQLGQTTDPDIYALGDCAEVCGIVKFYVAPLRACSAVVAQNLVGGHQKIVYDPMPVMLKTPSYPICFCYLTAPKTWEVTVDAEGIKALAHEGDNLVGYVLTDKKLADRLRYKKAMASWLPAE